MKVDLTYFSRMVSDGQHRPLRDDEVTALRGYRTTWRSAMVALLDAGMSYHELAGATVNELTEEGTLTRGPTLRQGAQELLKVHRHFMLLSGAGLADPLIPVSMRAMPIARRDAAIDLGIPSEAPQRARTDGAVDRWRRALGVSLVPLAGQRLPTSDTVKRRAKEAAR